MSDVIDRANDVLERADLLDDAVAELHGYRSLLEDLNRRSPVNAPPEHVRAIRLVRAAILRSAIGLAVAILDATDRRGNRASFGHIFSLLKDTAVADILFSPNPKRDAKPIRQRLGEAQVRYNNISAGPLLQRIRDLRHNQIAHLLVRDEPIASVEYTDIFALTDEIEMLLTTLYEGFGKGLAHFVGLKARTTGQAKLFWQTYFAGMT